MLADDLSAALKQVRICVRKSREKTGSGGGGREEGRAKSDSLFVLMTKAQAQEQIERTRHCLVEAEHLEAQVVHAPATILTDGTDD